MDTTQKHIEILNRIYNVVSVDDVSVEVMSTRHIPTKLVIRVKRIADFSKLLKAYPFEEGQPFGSTISKRKTFAESAALNILWSHKGISFYVQIPCHVLTANRCEIVKFSRYGTPPATEYVYVKGVTEEAETEEGHFLLQMCRGTILRLIEWIKTF